MTGIEWLLYLAIGYAVASATVDTEEDQEGVHFTSVTQCAASDKECVSKQCATQGKILIFDAYGTNKCVKLEPRTEDPTL